MFYQEYNGLQLNYMDFLLFEVGINWKSGPYDPYLKSGLFSTKTTQYYMTFY